MNLWTAVLAAVNPATTHVARCVSKTSLWRKYTSKVSVILFIYSLYPLSSFPLVYAFANVLMRCVVTMVSNVSDSSDAWSGMLLHAHMLQHSLMPHRTSNTRVYTCICTNAHTHIHSHTLRGMPLQRGCACILVYKEYTCKSASGVCQDETAAASCMRRETSCCLAANRGRSANISTNQLCCGWMQEVSLTASRRKTQKHYEATR